MIKVAVLGGAFDPVHNEHIKIALAAVKELGIEKLVLLPASNPPHKNIDGENFCHRVKMLKQAFENFPAEVEICEIESQNISKNYTVDNLPKLKKLYGDFYYLIGGDSLLNFEQWYKPEVIVKLTNVVVFNRKGYEGVSEKVIEYEKKWNCKIKIMEYVGENVSSSSIRAKLYLGMDTDDIPDSVLNFIKENNYYTDYLKIVNKAKGYLSNERFFHSKNTVLTAIEINNRCNLQLPYDKIFIAGILHDIGKKNCYNGLDIPSDSVGTPVEHQFTGAELACTDFNINDAEILNAIRYHTTSRPNMSNLEKLIFVADMLSYERNYSGIDNLRSKVYNNFNKGFYACINYSYNYLLNAQKPVYPLTEQAVEFYKENK